MVLKNSIIFLILLTCMSLCQSVSAAEEGKKQNRVEELFIWKISDELKLNITEEKSISTLLKNLNQKKNQINSEIQNSIHQLKEAKTNSERSLLLGKYRQKLREMNDLSLKEIDGVQKILGVERTAKYLNVKNELVAKIKNLIANPEKDENPKIDKKLITPKIIEE